MNNLLKFPAKHLNSYFMPETLRKMVFRPCGSANLLKPGFCQYIFPQYFQKFFTVSTFQNACEQLLLRLLLNRNHAPQCHRSVLFLQLYFLNLINCVEKHFHYGEDLGYNQSVTIAVIINKLFSYKNQLFSAKVKCSKF